jgi:hypothetical protein
MQYKMNSTNLLNHINKMFGLETAFKKVTDLLPLSDKDKDKDGGGKDKDKDDKAKDSTGDKDKDKDKDKKEVAKKDETKKDETKKPSSSPPAETYEEYLIACVRSLTCIHEVADKQVDSHAGYLAPAIKGLANALDTSLITIGFALAVILLAIHLSLPIFMTPHFSSLITLIIPVQSTITYIKTSLHMPPRASSKYPEPSKVDKITGEEKEESIYKEEFKKWEERDEKRKIDEVVYKAATKVVDGGPQWIWFWVFYILVNGVRGLVGIYRPGWKGWYELWRSVVLVVVAGPWYTKAALDV